MMMTFIRSEDRSTRTAAELLELRTLAELPEKLVISQIRQATYQLGSTKTWASQPGMIRRYDDSEDGDKPRNSASDYYKLYSASFMHLGKRGSPGDEFATEAKAFQEWATSPATFADLNQPILVSPRRKPGERESSVPPTPIYPILDPAAHDLMHIDGFEVTDPHGTPTSPLPMPAQWLYVLRDGSIVAPASITAGSTKIDLPGPSKTNPIIGRIAFWTDDESCKLNLNTATEPAPWAAPRTHTRTDDAHARSQPIQGEHYRDPSHPAYTSLSPVLRHFSGGTLASLPKREPADPLGNAPEWWEYLRSMHGRLPRTFLDQANLGSNGGTRETTASNVSAAVLTKRQPLFTTTDEFFFNPERQLNGRGVTSPPLDMTQDDLRYSRFFLTTHSRAPETNPFNRPKISLWPVQETLAERNSTDEQLAALATLDSHAYYFQRASLWTGSGTSGSSQSATDDINLERNLRLLGTLQELTERDFPGIGHSFRDKYGPNGRDHILTSMFDFIRSNANPGSPQSTTTDTPTGSEYSYLPPGFGIAGNTSGTAEYSAVPTRLPDFMHTSETTPAPSIQGFGRFPTISEIALVFVATAGENNVTDAYPEFADKTTAIQTFVIIQPYIVAPGVPATSPAVCYRIRGLENLQIESTSLGLPAHVDGKYDAYNRAVFSSSTMLPATGQSWSGHSTAYAALCAPFLTPAGQPKTLLTSGTSDPDANYPFAGTLTFPTGAGKAAGTKLKFSGTSNNGTSNGAYITVDIFPAAEGVPTANAAPIQSIQVFFPETEIPVPVLPVDTSGAPTSIPFETRLIAQQSGATGSGAHLNLIQRGDVVRSMAVQGDDRGINLSLTRGDMRLLASAPQLVPATTDPADPSNPTGLPRVPDAYTLNGLIYHHFAPTSVLVGPDLVPWNSPNFPNSIPPTAIGAEMPAGFEAHSLRDGNSTANQPASPLNTSVADTAKRAGNLTARRDPTNTSATLSALDYDLANTIGTTAPAIPRDLSGAFNLDNRAGDFDNGPGLIEDGPYINKPDFGNALASAQYFDRGSPFAAENGLTYNPSRGLSSALAFGSLPSGLFGSGNDPSPRPWQTLLFCPHPPSRLTPASDEPDYKKTGNPTDKLDHFGFANPRDHLWAEFFWLPHTDPPGLSEGFATEGKVNMNYQMLPYTWITRATALHGALHGVRLTAIPSPAAEAVGTTNHYKASVAGANPAASLLQFDYSINAKATLEAFSDRFKTGDLFRSPSEICDIWLVPERLNDHDYGTLPGGLPKTPPTGDGAYKNMLTWWEGTDLTSAKDGFEATGDNTREAPYAQLYPRLTTRSNVFTVHYRVQLLKKSRTTKIDEWDEAKDNVAAEYRGSTVIERYLDPTQKGVTDFAETLNTSEALDDYYQWRTVRRTQFAP